MKRAAWQRHFSSSPFSFSAPKRVSNVHGDTNATSSGPECVHDTFEKREGSTLRCSVSPSVLAVDLVAAFSVAEGSSPFAWLCDKGLENDDFPCGFEATLTSVLVVNKRASPLAGGSMFTGSSSQPRGRNIYLGEAHQLVISPSFSTIPKRLSPGRL